MIKDAEPARAEAESLRGGAVDVENSLLVLGQSKPSDLVVFAADLPLTQIQDWASVLKKMGRRANLLYASLNEAENNVVFEKFSMGNSREEVFADRS